MYIQCLITLQSLRYSYRYKYCTTFFQIFQDSTSDSVTIEYAVQTALAKVLYILDEFGTEFLAEYRKART